MPDQQPAGIGPCQRLEALTVAQLANLRRPVGRLAAEGNVSVGAIGGVHQPITAGMLDARGEADLIEGARGVLAIVVIADPRRDIVSIIGVHDVYPAGHAASRARPGLRAVLVEGDAGGGFGPASFIRAHVAADRRAGRRANAGADDGAEGLAVVARELVAEDAADDGADGGAGALAVAFLVATEEARLGVGRRRGEQSRCAAKRKNEISHGE